jgi:putative peptide maturation system protein
MNPTADVPLADAIALLQALPRERARLPEARGRFHEFRRDHPGLRADLLVDQSAGSPRVDFDLLLGHPAGGTLALAWRADDGVPWNVEYADHWTANLVLAVNRRPVTVQQALMFLRFTARTQPDLMTELVEQQLIDEVIEADPTPVSGEALQAAADRFRRENGLHGADATRRWLQEMGLTVERFEELLAWAVRREQLEEQVTAEGIAPYFEAHRARFDRVSFVRVGGLDDATARRLAVAARRVGLLATAQAAVGSDGASRLDIRLATGHAFELPAWLAAAPAGAVVGPADGEGALAEVLSRSPAVLDVPTRWAIRSLLFRQWLRERRERAAVLWHGL